MSHGSRVRHADKPSKWAGSSPWILSSYTARSRAFDLVSAGNLRFPVSVSTYLHRPNGFVLPHYFLPRVRAESVFFVRSVVFFADCVVVFLSLFSCERFGLDGTRLTGSLLEIVF